MKLDGSVAFVTGAGGGLGSRISAQLAEAGADIAVGYRAGRTRASATCQAVQKLGRRSEMVKLDQSDPVSVESAIAQVIENFGRLDIVVNNAAIAMGGHSISPGDLSAFEPHIWDEMMAINLRGPFLVTRAAAPYLRASPLGHVVNIGSTIGHGDWYADRAFAPSKAAVVPLTKFLAASLAPDVNVNCVCPGLMIETGLGSGGSEHLVQGWRDRSALNVTTSVDDVAAQVVSLCRSSTITGQSIVVDGGIHFH